MSYNIRLVRGTFTESTTVAAYPALVDQGADEDSLATDGTMMPGMNLSRFPQVVVGARISASGNATPQAGDLQGLSEPLAPTADTAVSVAISEVVG